MPRRPRARQQFLASQNAANAARRQALQRAQTVRPAQVGQPAPGGPPAASPPGQPQQAGTPFAPDAQYLAEAASRQFERQQAMQQLTTTGENDKTDTAEALRRLLQKAPDERRGIKEGANRAGLFYSGHLGKSLGDYEANLAQQQGDINTDAQRREDARAAARRAIEQGAPLEEAAALAESATRQVDRDTQAADAGALVPPVVTPPRPVPVRRPARRRRRR